MKDNDHTLSDKELEEMEVEEILDETTESLDSGELQPKEESESGVFNLAQMVSNASITQASDVVEDTGPFETAVSDIPPAASTLGKRKYIIPIVAVMAILLVSGTVAIIIAQRKKVSAHEEAQKLKVALLQAQIEQFQGRTEPPALEMVGEPVTEQKEELEQEKVEITPVEAEEVEPESGEVPSETEDIQVETKQNKREQKKTSGQKRSARRRTKKVVSKPAETKKNSKKSGDNELDRLLGVGSNSAKKRGSSGTTVKPSRADIKAAMKQVASRAKACSRFAKGTVQLKMTIAGRGHVKASRVVGSFANTQAGDCVKKAARAAKFPKFSDPSFTFVYPVILK